MPIERPNPIPDWAKRERASDLFWMQEHLKVFWGLASEGFQESGRGLLVVDLQSSVEDEGTLAHPVFYFSQSLFQAGFWTLEEETVRLVNEYDPSWEFVTMLLKPGRESAYRVGIPSLQKPK